MITTRSLLPDWVTASWMDLNLQSLKSVRFRLVSAEPSSEVSFTRGWVGRNTYPTFLALAIAFDSRVIESGWHTTRVTPGPPVATADASVRAVGTSPPAHGLTEQSGPGSGQ